MKVSDTANDRSAVVTFMRRKDCLITMMMAKKLAKISVSYCKKSRKLDIYGMEGFHNILTSKQQNNNFT